MNDPVLHRDSCYRFLVSLRHAGPPCEGPVSAFQNFYSFLAQDTVGKEGSTELTDKTLARPPSLLI